MGTLVVGPYMHSCYNNTRVAGMTGHVGTICFCRIVIDVQFCITCPRAFTPSIAEQNRTEQKLYSTKTYMNYIGFSCHKSSDKENTYKNINYKHTKTTK